MKTDFEFIRLDTDNVEYFRTYWNDPIKRLSINKLVSDFPNINFDHFDIYNRVDVNEFILANFDNFNFPKMNPELKTKWLEALRSGNYAQTKETLKDKRGYCCLGVLCDAVGAECLATKVDEDHDDFDCDLDEQVSLKYHFRLNNSDYFEDLLTEPALEYCSLHHLVQDVLAYMNDHNRTFAEIADFIEKYL
jgi:hypothetical protein